MSYDPAELRRLHREQLKQARDIARGGDGAPPQNNEGFIGIERHTAGGGHVPDTRTQSGIGLGFRALLGLARMVAGAQMAREDRMASDRIMSAVYDAGSVRVRTVDGRYWSQHCEGLIGFTSEYVTVRTMGGVTVFNVQGRSVRHF